MANDNGGFFTSAKSGAIVNSLRKVSNNNRQSKPIGYSRSLNWDELIALRNKNGISRQLFSKRRKSGMTDYEAASTPPKTPEYRKINYWRFVTKHADIEVDLFNINDGYYAVAVMPSTEETIWTQSKIPSKTPEDALRELQNHLSSVTLIIEIVPPGQPTRKEIRCKTKRTANKSVKKDLKCDPYSQRTKSKRFGDDDEGFDMNDLSDIFGGEYAIDLYHEE